MTAPGVNQRVPGSNAGDLGEGVTVGRGSPTHTKSKERERYRTAKFSFTSKRTADLIRVKVNEGVTGAAANKLRTKSTRQPSECYAPRARFSLVSDTPRYLDGSERKSKEQGSGWAVASRCCVRFDFCLLKRSVD